VDLNLGAADEGFRQEVRAFLAEHWPRAKGSAVAGPEAAAFRTLATERGYLYRAVPKAYGGSEQAPDPVRGRIIREEFAAAGAPMELTTPGVKMLVGTLLEHGREDQKQRFIRKTLLGEYKWCQGYSEPGSGSDLASLKTRAELVGDEWIINGQKLWTSRAREADFMFILVRTEPDAPKHDGISYLLLDMKQPGITVRPLREMTGSSVFNEVFFDNARTPADWIVGARGQGWKVSSSTLKHERDAIGSSQTTEQLFSKLVQLARETVRDGRPLIERPDVQQALARIEGFILSQKYSSYYQLSMAAAGRETPLLRMTAKLVATDIGHDVARLAQMLIGDDGLLMPTQDRKGPHRNAKWVNQIMGSLGNSIAGGTSNIQRNIIAERGLGLPREDRAA